MKYYIKRFYGANRIELPDRNLSCFLLSVRFARTYGSYFHSFIHSSMTLQNFVWPGLFFSFVTFSYSRLLGRLISLSQDRKHPTGQHNHRINGFEPTIPAFERANTVPAIDRVATTIGSIILHLHYPFILKTKAEIATMSILIFLAPFAPSGLYIRYSGRGA
jgi:dolichol kinase